MPERRLGRKAVKTDTRTLRMARYLTAILPPPPPSVDWTKDITSFGELLNDSLGCCTCSGVGHAVQIWTANTGTEATVTDDEVLAIYEKWCGYNPADPASDAGGVEIDVLTDWKAQGFAGHKLLGFADPEVGNATEIEQAINLFGGLYIGLNVPQSVMNNADDTSIPWDVTGDNTIIGGHCVYIVGYASGIKKLISWGQVYTMTDAFWATFVDEAHALVSPDFVSPKGTPEGFSLDQLLSDLAAIN